MKKAEVGERIDHLKKVINRHRYLYHVLDKQEISEEALDSLKKELFDLERQFPDLITSDSPTQRVGGEPLTEFKKVKHEQPMLSLNDAFSEQDMRDWLERLENYLGETVKTDFYCNLKMDGLAIELVYKNGILAQGSTRGDGFMGEDVTHNVKTIESIPLRLNERDSAPIPERLIVRGEVFLIKKEFERINRELGAREKTLYANPRNLAAGTMRQLDPAVAAERKLNFYGYDIVGAEQYARHDAVRQAIKEFGFAINRHGRVCASLAEVFSFHQKWEKERKHLPYEIDGVFVAVNDNRMYSRAGVVGKTPRAAIAYKFSPKEAATVVENIVVQVGRTGVLTPVAAVKPVEVSGITISHATLHNYDEIKRLGLKIGDTVIVSRAGDVIPQITKVLADLRTGKEKNIHVPDRCPIDGSPVVHEGVFYRCANKECGAVLERSVRHFVSRGAFNIEGLGKKIITRFLDEGLISDAADIFALQTGDIAALAQFGEKSAENIVNEISRKKEIALPRFLYALGITHVGEETARALANAIFNAQFPLSKPTDVLRVFQTMSLEDLQHTPDIGPIVARSIYDWFRGARAVRLLEKLDAEKIRIAKFQPIKNSGMSLAGKIFVLTGTIALPREEAKEKIRALGGEVSESLSKKTDYLVTGADPGSKLEKAKKIGVRILNEKDFLDLIKS